MTSTFTPNKNLELQATGDNVNAWGTHLNANVFTFLDTMLGGVLSISVAGNSDVTLSATQGQNIAHKLTGALTGSINYIFPATTASGPFIIDNQTTGAFTVTVKTAAGGSTGVIAPQGRKVYLYNDGTNFTYGVQEYETVNAQTGTTYTALASDYKKLVTFSNASAIAVTMPNAATASGFGSGYCVHYANIGAGTVTITPTTSTIGGAATLVLTTNQSAKITSDGTNYQVEKGSSTATSGVSSISDSGNGGLSFSSSTGAVSASLNVNDLLSKTTPVAADLVAIYDVAGAASKQATAAKMQIAGSGGGTTNFLRADGTWAAPAGSGTVMSVGISVPSDLLSVAGSPVTTSGTLALTKAAVAKNLGYLGPSSGANASPTFRAMVDADLPNLSIGGTYGDTSGTYYISQLILTASGRISTIKFVPVANIPGGGSGGGGGGGGGSCFPGFAQIEMADGTFKRMDEVRIGDKLAGAYDEINIVLALERPILGTRMMFHINREHWTSDEHAHLTPQHTWESPNPNSTYHDWRIEHTIIRAGGVIEKRFPKCGGTVIQMREGHVLLKRKVGPTTIKTFEIGNVTDWPSETQLYHLMMDGSGVYCVDGYIASGWSDEERWDYTTWQPKS